MGSGGMVVVDLGKVKGKDGWTPVTNGGLNGLIFRKEKTHGIVGAGSEGKMCFSIKPGMAGDYMATAVSAAPHGSDNNDMWFGSSKGWKLLQAGSFYTPDPKPFEFRKAYQNMGGRRLADYISTKDHDGHYFVAPNVGENETIQICIAGRSYKYEVFKIILVKCNSRFCTGGRGAERGSLVKKAASKCT